MESSAIQLRLILTSVAFGISMSCNIRSNDTQYSRDSIATERRSGSSANGIPDNYSTLSYRNGVIPNSEIPVGFYSIIQPGIKIYPE